MKAIILGLLALPVINTAVVPGHSGQDEPGKVLKSHWNQQLLHPRSVGTDGGRLGGEGQLVKRREEDRFFDANCSNINDFPRDKYNSSCEAVKEECGDIYELFNYLKFVTCDLNRLVGYVFLVLWLMYLLLLLSTTVDNFFVPVLQMLSDRLRLPPSTAGTTLLALGNGAPDIFVAFSALQDDDVALMMGALMGAALFIISVIVGTILIVSPTKTYNINPVDYLRDVIAYILVLILIVVVAYDGKVTLIEAICFPLLYSFYIAVVVALTYLKNQQAHCAWLRKLPLAQKIHLDMKESTDILSKNSFTSQDDCKPQKVQETSLTEEKNEAPMKSSVEEDYVLQSKQSTSPLPMKEKENKEENKTLKLVGITVPKGIVSKILFVVLWPFSFLRWLTIPPCCHDGQWSIFHFIFAVASPVPMSILLLIIVQRWEGIVTLVNGHFPLSLIIILCVSPLSVVLFFTLSHKKPPHWIMQWLLMLLAFVMSVAWLKVIADEVVNVLQALGLLSGISTAILGLTVLAIGNSVADWVADIAVTLKGKPEMGLASCFGAPLITNVMGISFALITRIAENNGAAYLVPIWNDEFVQVKLAWIFLGIVLIPSVMIFMAFRFNPPKEFGLVLMYIYIVFMIFSVLIETNVLKISL